MAHKNKVRRLAFKDGELTIYQRPGMVYSIDQRWNKQFDDRKSLLNLEHGYIP
ncbi:hypothetical protein ACX8XN_08065 [Calditrichota bacterium GD2]